MDHLDESEESLREQLRDAGNIQGFKDLHKLDKLGHIVAKLVQKKFKETFY